MRDSKEEGMMPVEARPNRAWGVMALWALVACGLSAAAASAASFSAKETHRCLVVDDAGGTTGKLGTNGWSRGAGALTFVYRQGGTAVAGVWAGDSGAVVVRSGTTAQAPIIGRVVPSYDDNRIQLTIEPAGGVAVRTTVFKREPGDGKGLGRGISTIAALHGTYRATLTPSAGGKEVGW